MIGSMNGDVNSSSECMLEVGYEGEGVTRVEIHMSMSFSLSSFVFCVCVPLILHSITSRHTSLRDLTRVSLAALNSERQCETDKREKEM